MRTPLLKFIVSLLGLSGLAVIITEVFKKWGFISTTLSPVWVVIPVLMLYIAKKITHYSYIRNRTNLPPNLLKSASAVINAILIILFILTVIAIPFVWFGAIEESARKAN